VINILIFIVIFIIVINILIFIVIFIIVINILIFIVIIIIRRHESNDYFDLLKSSVVITRVCHHT
jgi:hypothetical protein